MKDRRDQLLEELRRLDLAIVQTQPPASNFALVSLKLSHRRLKDLYNKYKIDSFMFELSEHPMTAQRIYINDTVTPILIKEFIQDLGYWNNLDKVEIEDQ